MARPTNNERVSMRLKAKEPFDLPLCLKAASSFSARPTDRESTLRIPARIDHEPVIIEVRQLEKHPPVFKVACSQGMSQHVGQIASYVLGTDLDLRPFYRLAASDPRLGAIVNGLRGLRPLRPASLFEMLATAITEQQITLRLAFLMREKITARFGDTVGGVPVFPDESALSAASLAELVGCGLSHRKAEYIRDISRMVAGTRLDLEELKAMSDDDAYAALTQIRGVGPWTADYVLVRGLGRTDRVPVEDIGVRRVVGKYLGKGDRAAAGEVLTLLRPFEPYKGLAAYYLLVHDRLGRAKNGLLRPG